MVVQKLHDYFNLLIDKFGSPYFTDDEIDLFLNAGQNELFQQYFPDNEDYQYNIELNQHTAAVFSKLIDTKVMETITSISKILYTEIDSVRKVSKILNVMTEDNEPVGFMRHNDLSKSFSNDFLQPEVGTYYFKYIADGIEIVPSSVKNILVTYIKEPLDIDLLTNQSSELASFLHYDLVAEAIDKAGVATRDQAMTQLNQV